MPYAPWLGLPVDSGGERDAAQPTPGGALKMDSPVDPARELAEARARQQREVAELGLRALAGVSPETLAEMVGERVAATLGVEYTEVLELLPAGDELRLRAGVGWRPGSVGTATVGAGRDSQGGYTLLRDTPVLVEDLPAERRFQGPPLLLEHGVVSGMTVVIQGPAGPWGVLGAHTREHRRFTPDDASFLQGAANVLGQALSRAAVEARLRASRDEIAAILRSVGDGIVVHDPEFRVVYANDAAAHLLGYERAADLTGLLLGTVRERYEARDEAGALLAPGDFAGERVARGEADSVEQLLRLRFPDRSEERWTEVRASAVRGSEGRARLVVNVLRDVTRSVDQQRALEEQASQLEESAVELETKLDELQVRTREAEEARAAAEAAERRSGFLSEAGRVLSSSLDYEVTLRSVARLSVQDLADWCVVHVMGEEGELHRLEVAHADPEKLRAALELERLYPPQDGRDTGVMTVIRSGKPELYPVITDEMLAATARDEEHLRRLRELGIDTAMTVPLVARGRTVGAIQMLGAAPKRYGPGDLALAEELARRAAAAVDNARLYAEAQEANRAKSNFLAVVSHELRTPLNAIMGYTDLLDAGVAGELEADQHKHLGRIRTSSKHLLQLIEEILEYARIEAGREDVRIDVARITDIAAEAAAVVEPLSAAKGLELRVDADPAAAVRTDTRKVRQILLNLLSNAVKFTEHGSVELQATVEGEEVVFRVRDTGIGIPADMRESIFQAFWQVEQPNTRRTGGTGLGLSVARRLAHLLGGTLTVDSQPDQGSTFTLRLPGDATARARRAAD